MKSSYSVLIVGAGPTGMALAAELQNYGIDFLIIDKRPSHVTTSNAAGIHARTLECWYKRPWSKAFFEKGVVIKGASINARDKRLAFFDFSQLHDTQYKMILSIPQNQTEAILDNFLTSVGKPVLRNTTLHNVSIKHDEATAHISTLDMDREISADWIVGCDGYHSTVRDYAGIQFKGEDLEERFLLIDADFKADYEEDSFHVYLTPEGILAFFVMQESTRIIAGVGHDPLFKDVKEPTVEVMSAIIKNRTNLKFSLSAMRWQSHFWIHERVAQHYKKGPIFIAGDAAHVHSPAGGQGMNTGIQDAFNLAWKLAYVIKGYAPESLLDSYEVERHPIAKGVVSMTSKMTTMASIENPLLVALRNNLLPFVAKKKIFQREMVGRMSEIALNYRSSSIVSGKKLGGLAPGDRAPDVQINEDSGTHVFDKLVVAKHNLLIFHADKNEAASLERLQIKYRNQINNIFVASENKCIAEVYAFDDFTMCLIRPDGYIGCLTEDISELESYLEKYLLHVKHEELMHV